MKTHHTDSKVQCARYNKSVNKIAKKFENELFIDPFKAKYCPGCLVNLATGVEASSQADQSIVWLKVSK